MHRWIFIVEGIVAIAVGLIVIALLPGAPDKVVKTGSLFIRKEEELQLIAVRYHACKLLLEDKSR